MTQTPDNNAAGVLFTEFLHIQFEAKDLKPIYCVVRMIWLTTRIYYAMKKK